MPIHSAQVFEWKLAPAEIELKAGQVHIWKVLLDNVYSDEAGSILSAEEMQRTLRLVSPQKRARFQCARIVLRKILSQYLHQSPVNIQIKYGPFGKPILSSPSKDFSELEFNVSHADNLMLAAFTTCGPIGIDLESQQSIQAMEKIVKSYFSPGDQEKFRNIPQDGKEQAFLSAWVMKEAYGKSLGSGLASPPARNFITRFTQITIAEQHYVLSQEDAFQFLRFLPSYSFSAAAVIQTAEKPEFLFWEFENNG